MIEKYPTKGIETADIPNASDPVFQHLLDTYASEINKLVSVWHEFTPEEISFRPHPRSSSVEEILKHELLSERRFFGEFLSLPEPPPTEVLPAVNTPVGYAARLLELVPARMKFLATQDEAWWLSIVPFFDVQRERIWIFWRRLLHTAHHRTQLTVYLRLLNKTVPSTYGPTADITWSGADPTRTVEAANRK